MFLDILVCFGFFKVCMSLFLLELYEFWTRRYQNYSLKISFCFVLSFEIICDFLWFLPMISYIHLLMFNIFSVNTFECLAVWILLGWRIRITVCIHMVIQCGDLCNWRRPSFWSLDAFYRLLTYHIFKCKLSFFKISLKKLNFFIA